jgi:hypothetical protein
LNIDPTITAELNENINSPITKDEIFKGIKNLKNNKAFGDDQVINEYMKTTSNQFVDNYEKLFNLIFDTGIIPESWLLGTMKPFYKNKGNKNDPKNDRPITILSCLGKLAQYIFFFFLFYYLKKGMNTIYTSRIAFTETTLFYSTIRNFLNKYLIYYLRLQ